ncbi:MAG: phospholipid carrier-dependent glycosyltransferase, partial [Chloroflexi bacterium]|nr:phospholipid carrier-dependent glycosyltransferase [Chloroflexota bacterium]
MSRRSRAAAWFWLVVAATLWAAFSRLYHLATLPPQAWVDEVWYNLRARDLLQTGDLQVFYRTFWGGMHPLMVDLAAVVQAMGFNSLVASRGVAAVGGVLTIPLAFACFDELWRREAWPTPRRRLTAALTALILSNLLYLVVAGRIGYGPALIPPVTLFYVWQIRRAQRTAQWTGWILAGLALGLAQYVNLNGRFILPLVGLLALHDLIRAHPAQRRPLTLRLGLCAGVAVLAALPLIIFFIREPEWIFARARAVKVTPQQTGPGFLLDNLRLILLSFNIQGDFNPRHNLPGRPICDAGQSIGFLAGIVWAITRFRRSTTARELPLWTAMMTVSSLITSEAPQFERMIGVAAPAAALVAIGWVGLWEWASQPLRVERIKTDKLRQAGVSALSWLAPTPVLISLGLNAYALFVRYPVTPGLAEAMTATPVTLARQLIERARREPVFVERISGADDVFAFDFLFPGTPVRRLDFRQCLPLADRRATRTTYLVLAEHDQQTTEALARAFPSATIQYLRPEAAALMGDAALVEVPPETTAPPVPVPVHARFDPGIRLLGYAWSGATVEPGESIFLTLYWEAEANLDADLTTFLHVGAGLGDSRVVAQHDGQPCQGLYPTSLWRAGDVIPDGFAVTMPVDTPPGDYAVAVGWYRYPSLERLPLTSADTPLPDNRAVIARVTVTASLLSCGLTHNPSDDQDNAGLVGSVDRLGTHVAFSLVFPCVAVWAATRLSPPNRYGAATF